MQLQPENIPSELRQRDQWILWKEIGGEDGEKPRKVPVQVNRSFASTTDPSTWAAFEDVLASVGPDVSGIGFVFTDDDPFVGIDVDEKDCVDEVLATVPGYAERSPSGLGAHIICRGSIEKALKTAEVEVYGRARYFTVTGDVIDGRTAIEDGGDGLVRLVEKYGEEKETEVSPQRREDRKEEEERGGRRQRFVMAAVDGELDAVARAAESTRNNQLNESAFKLGTLVGAGAYRRADAEAGLMQSARQCGLKESEARRTIRSGLESGMKKPRTDLPEEDSPRRRNTEVLPQRRQRAAQKRGKEEEEGIREESFVESTQPLELARHFLRYRTRRLIRWQEGWYSYTGTHYAELSEEALDRELYRHLDGLTTVDAEGETKPVVARANLIREVRLALPACKGVFVDEQPPCWLAGDGPEPHGLIACTNGLLCLGTGELHEHSERLFTLHSLRYRYEPDAGEPGEWLRFLGEVFDADEQCIDTLQQMFGYYLSNETGFQKIGLLIGPKRSGKGTIARVLRGMVGEEHCAGPTLSGLGMDYGMQSLIGKRLAIISDARLSGRTDQAQVIERLLTVSGEDSISIPRKYKDHWTGKLPTRLLLLTNELPRMTDNSGALASRFVMVDMRRSWFGEEDLTLGERLLAELPGILNWAVEGYVRLMEQGRFCTPERAKEMVQDLEDMMSPVGAFVRDRCTTGGQCEVGVDELYDAWKEYCKEMGRDFPGTKNRFGRDLRSVLPDVQTEQRRLPTGGRRIRIYRGIDID